MGEECESAALEAIWQKEGDAFRIGRSAALDELRRLTKWRGSVRVRVVSGDIDVPLWDDYNLEYHDILAEFTGRNRFILERLAGGWTNRQIAAMLGVTESAISFRLRQIRAKLGGRGACNRT